MIFVDTSPWFAFVVDSDPRHPSVLQLAKSLQQPLLTTDYVVDETLTLLRSRGKRLRALELGAMFFSGSLATIHYLTQDEIIESWKVFSKFDDKDWSFTDCTSKVVIEKLKVSQAISFDEHFRQFGSVVLLP